jgi:hypothetical protein
MTLTRRRLIAGAAAGALLPALPGGAGAQQPTLNFVGFAQRMRALSGFDPLPRDLLRALHAAAEEEGGPDIGALTAEDGAPNDAQKRALKALYHGIWTGKDEEKTRLAFSEALQWAAIEDTNNVISFCGGVPGFWAEPPAAG